MYAVPTIPGVSLEVYKQNRLLKPEQDGYVGKLYSGFATILAVIDSAARLAIGMFRDGQDHYIKIWDWLADPAMIVKPYVKEQQEKRRAFLGSRQFTDGSKVFGVKIPLRVNERSGINTVHYPENMLMLAQYTTEECIVVWKIALVSQDGDFFLTVQDAYNVHLYEDEHGDLRIPRLDGHRQLQNLLIANAPEDFKRFPIKDFFDAFASTLPQGLKPNEGVVDRWYAARNMGCVFTHKGPARVHWSDVPPRPRLRYLVTGERVRIGELSTPPKNPRTDWRKIRKARFQLQAGGIEVG